MTNVERTKGAIDTAVTSFEHIVTSSNVTLQQTVDQLQDSLLMDIAFSLANIADSLATIKDKLTEESK